MTTLNQIGITIDCDDASLLASFWESCLGYTRRPATSGGPYVTLERGNGGPDGPPLITVQTVPEPKTGKARIHLDLFVAHAQPLVNEMQEAGASVLTHTEAGDWTTRVLRDPAGNEFCVIGPD